MAAALADDSGNVFLAAFEFVGERVITLRLLYRIEIFALHVFDDGNLERIRITDIDRYDRHFVQSGNLRCPPAPLTRHNLEAIMRTANGTDHDRLDHAMLLDRSGKFSKLGLGKFPPRIARVRPQEFNRHLALRARPVDMRSFAADISDQTCKTAPQSRTCFLGHRQLPWIQLMRSRCLQWFRAHALRTRHLELRCRFISG